MQTIFEAIHRYTGFHGCRSHCHLQIVLTPDRPAVVIASELPDNEGTSVTNMAERLAGEVCRRYAIDPDTLLWIERYPADGDFPERYATVEFERSRMGEFRRPIWRPIRQAHLEALIGLHLGT